MSENKLKKEQEDAITEEDQALECLANILTDSFFKIKARENPKFIYPKIIDPIKEMVKKSKLRDKLFKNKS